MSTACGARPVGDGRPVRAAQSADTPPRALARRPVGNPSIPRQQSGGKFQLPDRSGKRSQADPGREVICQKLVAEHYSWNVSPVLLISPQSPASSKMVGSRSSVTVGSHGFLASEISPPSSMDNLNL